MHMSRTKHHGYNNKKREYGDNWHWMKQEPKAWRKEFKHKPRRAELKDKLNKFKNGEEDIVWPLDKKPWIYYW